MKIWCAGAALLITTATGCNCNVLNTSCRDPWPIPREPPPPPDIPPRPEKQRATSSGQGSAVPTLQYFLLNRAEAEYLLVDLLHVSIGSGQNAINATNAHQVTAELDLVPASEGLEVSGRVTGMDGTSTPFRGPPISVSADGRSGNTEFRVSGRGLITVVTEPDISYEAWSPNDLYRSMFASMPGRDTGRGSRWTDTISVAEDNVHGRLEYSRIETSVWDQDTIVAGWLLNVVRTRSEVSLKFQGVLGGFEVDQTLRGISIASVFWHPARRLVYERQETMDLTGRTSIEALGIEGEATVVSRRKTTRLRN